MQSVTISMGLLALIVACMTARFSAKPADRGHDDPIEMTKIFHFVPPGLPWINEQPEASAAVP